LFVFLQLNQRGLRTCWVFENWAGSAAATVLKANRCTAFLRTSFTGENITRNGSCYCTSRLEYLLCCSWTCHNL